QLAAMHGDETRAEALHTGKVLVAGRLVDGALAPEFCLDRNHRQAVGLHAAIAAALADGLIDHYALGWIGLEAALAPPPFFGGAGLIVDDGGDAGDLPEFALQPVQFVAVVHGRARREDAASRIFFRLVADDRDALQPFGMELFGDHRHV